MSDEIIKREQKAISLNEENKELKESLRKEIWDNKCAIATIEMMCKTFDETLNARQEIIERLQKELKEREELLSTQIQVLEEKLEKAISALEFYARRENWKDSNERTEPNNATSIIEDSDEHGMDRWGYKYFFGGKLARQTIKELKEGE